MKIVIVILKALLSFGITILLFISLPVIYRILGSDLLTKKAEIHVSPVVMKFEQKKEEKKKVEKVKHREVKSKSTGASTRSFTMKFTPDLGVGTSEGVAVEEQNLENVIFEEGEADVSAVPISRTMPPFPRRARESGICGTVEMILLIDRKGNVAHVDFVKIPHTMFIKPVERVVKEWKFKPAMNKGVPVKMRVRQNIEFTLDQ
jgi:TonB family protein